MAFEKVDLFSVSIQIKNTLFLPPTGKMEEDCDEDWDMDDETLLLYQEYQLLLAKSKSSVRSRHFYTRDGLVLPGTGTSWDKMWRASGDDCSFLTMVGFTREVFNEILLEFERNDERLAARAAAEASGERTGGRPPLLDGPTLMAIGLYYLTNRCQQKVVVYF